MNGSKEEFRERLRRLRRETESAPARRAPRSGMPEWLRRRLATGKARDSDPIREGGGDSPLRTRGLPLNLRTAVRGGETHAFRLQVFSPEHRHGLRRLRSVFEVDPEVFALLSGDPSLRGLELRSAVFLDTETTGLESGAGVFVFLVGLGRFTGRGFELWQGFLRGPEEEPALLREAARRIARARAVVSFFGKSFDRHRLEDKMRIHGVEPPFGGLRHLDLYHPMRRLHRGRLGDARLATVERAFCGFERDSDLPGSEAPGAWMDFLDGRPHLLEGVFAHNRDDVLSLVALSSWLGSIASTEDPEGGERREPPGGEGVRRLEIARGYAGLGDLEAARRSYRGALEILGEDAPDLPAALLEYLGLCRKARAFGEAEGAAGRIRTAAEALLDGNPSSPPGQALLRGLRQAALLFERDQRRLEPALACTRLALRLLARAVGGAPPSLSLDFEKRLRRLEARRARSGGRVPEGPR